MVLEEIEDHVARLVPELSDEPLYVRVTTLPDSFEIGDVFRAEKGQGSKICLKRDLKENEATRSKRKRLLSKSQNEKGENAD